MTIDHIRIETKEQADAVPERSGLEEGTNITGPFTAGGTGWRMYTPCDLTHVAIPVAQAIEARRWLLALIDEFGDGGGFGEAVRVTADLILPPPLADAAEQQAVAPGLIDGLQHLVNEYGLAGVRKVLDEHGSRFAQGGE